MTKQILIYKCEECPHAIFDRQDSPEYWGKWYCFNDNIREPMFLENTDVSHETPRWCPLSDYR